MPSLLAFFFLAFTAIATAAWPEGTRTEWHGYERLDFALPGTAATENAQSKDDENRESPQREHTGPRQHGWIGSPF